MSGRYVIGVDLGGTKIYTALAGENGEVLAEVKVRTKAEEGLEPVIGRIAESCRTVCAGAGVSAGKVAAVAVGTPGPLDTKSGLVYFAPNLKWRDVPLKALLEEALGLPVFLDNDANLAALGEHTYGAGRGVRDMVLISVGTGIGGGLVLNGGLYRGFAGGAGEIGHMVICPDGPPCGCGNRGCLEALASGTALARQAEELIKKGEGAGILAAAGGEPGAVDAGAVSAAAGAGDSQAIALFEEAGRYLGIGIANLAHLLDPELVVIGGGVAVSADLLFNAARREAGRASLAPERSPVRVVRAGLGGRAGLLGSVAMALEKMAE